nr:reverse transcriptase domain-containing protein [Tanacetum cinerariifolium]
MFKKLHINITLADALILIPKYQKMLKVLFSNKEKLLELANTPLNENCSAVILKKLPEKLGDPDKFLILCDFRELKCKALANLGASINLMPLSIWKKLGLPELISTRVTLELANRAICILAGIARDVFVSVGKFTFPANFVIVDYESDPIVPLILGRPFLRTARALIDVHRKEMILHFLEDFFATNHLNGNPTFSSHTDLTSPEVEDDIFDPEGDIELVDEVTLVTFLPRNDDLPFDIESDLREIEYLLNHDPTKYMDSILEDSIDDDNLAKPNDNLFDTIPEMFTDEHALDYSSPPLYDDYDDDLDEFESSDFLLSPEYDSFLFENFSEVDALPSTNNEDKVFNPGILIHENLFKVTTRVTLDKNVKKIAISQASLILEDLDPPPLYELPFHKEVPWSETLLSFSSENEEKVFKPEILTSKEVHSSLLLELSHRGPKSFKDIKILESPMKIFPCSYGEDIRILDVP